MGSIVPTIGSAIGAAVNTALPIAQTANSIYGLAQSVQGKAQQERTDDVLLQQLRDRSALEETSAAQDAALMRAEIVQAGAKDATARRDALRRAVARQRAAFGAGGIDPSATDGSAEAVLLGLVRQDARVGANDDDTALRLQALDNTLAQQKSLNLLQAAQLAKKQDLERLFD